MLFIMGRRKNYGEGKHKKHFLSLSANIELVVYYINFDVYVTFASIFAVAMSNKTAHQNLAVNFNMASAGPVFALAHIIPSCGRKSIQAACRVRH